MLKLLYSYSVFIPWVIFYITTNYPYPVEKWMWPGQYPFFSVGLYTSFCRGRALVKKSRSTLCTLVIMMKKMDRPLAISHWGSLGILPRPVRVVRRTGVTLVNIESNFRHLAPLKSYPAPKQFIKREHWLNKSASNNYRCINFLLKLAFELS